MIFVREMRPEVCRQHPELKGLEVMKEVGRRWKAIKPRDKVRYENKANVDK